MKKLLLISAVSLLTIVTTSVADALPSDDFNDNVMDPSLWNLYQENPNAWLEEINQRLELRSAAGVEEAVALYAANGWGFLTTNNFSFKADFHCSSTSGPEYSEFNVMLGIGKGVNDPVTIENNNATIAAGYYVDEYESESFFSCDKTTDGIHVNEGWQSRSQDNGTLYISYDASEDKLYLSDTGYDSPWVTISDLLKGEWDSPVVSLFLGGYVDNIALNSGDAFLDNFVVDSGSVIPEPATISVLGLGGLVLALRKRKA